MLPESLFWMAAGYWLAETQREKFELWPSREAAIHFIRDSFDLIWQTVILMGLARLVQFFSLSVTGADWASAGSVLAGAYGLSWVRLRVSRCREAYFWALLILSVMIQQKFSGSIELSAAGGFFLKAMGVSLLSAWVLLGLRDRLRWTWARFEGSFGPMSAFFCLGLMAIILWSMGF